MTDTKTKDAEMAVKEAAKVEPTKYGRVVKAPVVNPIEFDTDERFEGITITIVEPGLVGSNAILHGVIFEKGVSTQPVSRRQIDRIAASLRVSVEGDVETFGERLTSHRNVAPEREKPLTRGIEVKEVKKEKPEEKRYTIEELSAIADEKGINGLRVIADPLGLRSRSIPELIGKIMELRGVKVEKPEEKPVDPDLDEPVQPADDEETTAAAEVNNKANEGEGNEDEEGRRDESGGAGGQAEEQVAQG